MADPFKRSTVAFSHGLILCGEVRFLATLAREPGKHVNSLLAMVRVWHSGVMPCLC